MTKANHIKSYNILKEFKSVTMEQMKELSKKYHLNIDIIVFLNTGNSS